MFTRFFIVAAIFVGAAGTAIHADDKGPKSKDADAKKKDAERPKNPWAGRFGPGFGGQFGPKKDGDSNNAPASNRKKGGPPQFGQRPNPWSFSGPPKGDQQSKPKFPNWGQKPGETKRGPSKPPGPPKFGSKKPSGPNRFSSNPWAKSPWSQSPSAKSPWSKSPSSKSPWSKKPSQGPSFKGWAHKSPMKPAFGPHRKPSQFGHGRPSQWNRFGNHSRKPNPWSHWAWNKKPGPQRPSFQHRGSNQFSWKKPSFGPKGFGHQQYGWKSPSNFGKKPNPWSNPQWNSWSKHNWNKKPTHNPWSKGWGQQSFKGWGQKPSFGPHQFGQKSHGQNPWAKSPNPWNKKPSFNPSTFKGWGQHGKPGQHRKPGQHSKSHGPHHKPNFGPKPGEKKGPPSWPNPWHKKRS